MDIDNPVLNDATANTQSAGDNSTKVATTAYVDAASGAITLTGDVTGTGTGTVATTVVNAPASGITGTTLASNVVTSSLTGVGTLTAGTWNATTVAVTYGGTGQTSYTDGQLLIGNTTGNTLSKAVLTEGDGVDITNGSGSISLAADINNTNLQFTSGEINTIQDIGTASSPSFTGLTVSSLTAGRVPFVGTGGIIDDDGGFTYDNSTKGLKLSSTGDVSITLEADTNNAGEGDQPVIVFSQDGGVIGGFIGFSGSTNYFRMHSDTDSGVRLGVNGSDCLYVFSDRVGINTSGESQFSLDITGKLNNSPVGCSLYRSSPQSISDSTATVISWNAETEDTDGFHSTSTNADRITIPSGLGGKYMVQCSVWYASMTTTGANTITLVNESGTAYLQNPWMANTFAGGSVFSSTLDFDDGDIIRAEVFQTNGASRNLASGVLNTRISCWRVSETS